jgi:TPR repeat protein
MRARLLAVLSVLFLGLGGATADSIDDGVDAALSGDYAKAVTLLGAGVERGDARAEFFLGVLYESGSGVPRSPSEAAKLYRMSADQGLATAQNNLGSLYADGEGVKQDLAEAMRLWLLAADQGLPVAQTNLAAFYAAGTAGPKDLVQAYKWSALAVAGGYQEASDILQAVTQAISPEELASAQRLVKAWRPSETSGV